MSSSSGDLHSVALVGNPNSGKTTLFNILTGHHQHVGNYPGITVEQKEGVLHQEHGMPLKIIDLPGVYSLTAYTQEEIVARNVLIGEHPDVVLNIVNAGALERNLYLTVQLLELGIPIILALNMMDEAYSQGLTIDLTKISQKMGIPVFATVARTGKGINALIKEASDLAVEKKGKKRNPLVISYGPDLDPVVSLMEEKIRANNFFQDVPARWVAVKFLERDSEVINKGYRVNKELTLELEEKVSKVSEHLWLTLETSPEAIIADYRYGYISSVLRGDVVRYKDSTQQRVYLADKIDTILTHQFFGPIFMIIVMYTMYHITFVLGAVPMDWVSSLFVFLRATAEQTIPSGLLKSLVVSGIIDGVGGVVGFIPLIVIMFVQISILEDSGYMARMAYMLDRVFRFFGLHGCSVMPFIIGGGIAGGCAVPGILAARTLRSHREKLATLLVIPFMSCGAKLPVFILFSGIFFPGNEAIVMFGLTLAGWVVALTSAIFLRLTVIRGPSTPFVMELPPYRWPLLKGIIIHTYERTWSYLKKAGTTILFLSILLWAGMMYPKLPEAEIVQYTKIERLLTDEIEFLESRGENAESQKYALSEIMNAQGSKTLKNSFAGRLGVALEPMTKLAGFNWQTDIALIGGFVAKEVIIATLGTAYSLGDISQDNTSDLVDQIRQDKTWNPASALALLVFVLLYAPCLVTVVTIKQETGSWGWPLFSVVFNTSLAFFAAVAVRHVAMLFL